MKFRRRRRRISVWGLIFSCVISVLCSAFAMCVCAAEVGSGRGLSDISGERIGLLGIILTILAAISIIAVIVFSVRGKND